MTLRSRREMLAMSAGLAGAVVLAACGSDKQTSGTTPSSSSTAGTSPAAATTAAPATTAAAATTASVATTAAPGKAGGQIGFAWTDTAIEVYRPLIAGAKEEGKARGYEILESNNGGDVAKQLADVSTWVGQGVTGVVMLPIDPAATKNAAKEAKAKGVIVVGYSDKIEGEDGSTTFNHVQGGKGLGEHAAKWINDNLSGKAKIGLLVIDEMQVGRDRINSAMDVITAKTKSTVVGRVKAVSAAEALPAVQTMLQGNPDMNVVLCVADDGCSGASQAYKAAGIDPKGVYIAGWDGGLSALKSIKDGGFVKAGGALDLKEVGRSVVYVVDNVKKGKEPKDKVHDYVIVDRNSGKPLDDLIAAFA